MEQEIASFVSSVGFPIVAFYLMYKMVNQQMKETANALGDNNKTLTKIVTLLEQHFGGDIDGE